MTDQVTYTMSLLTLCSMVRRPVTSSNEWSCDVKWRDTVYIGYHYWYLVCVL